MTESLQWGGRFKMPPDSSLLRFGSSLERDLVLAPFDVQCSLAHVVALEKGGVLSAAAVAELSAALNAVAAEVANGQFDRYARASGAEDIHGAIDARVRELAPEYGESLHAGRSRNDQVATTLLLYCRDRAKTGREMSRAIALGLCEKAQAHLQKGTLLAATTHWQPAQPVLLAFWLCAAAEPFLRDMRRFSLAQEEATNVCPLGSAAVAGSSLPLDRRAAASVLGFTWPSRNAMDAIGNRDAALDLAHAVVRSVVNASRVCEELVLWCTPAFGYAQLGDAASTGSSLMPQKRNPDPFELVRALAANLTGRFAGALSTTSGIALSYHRDLQVTKAAIIEIVEEGLTALEAFYRALQYVEFNVERLNEVAEKNYVVATDVADALIAGGVPARRAHAQVGEAIRKAELDGTPLDWPGARASVKAKVTSGSTSPESVSLAIEAIMSDLVGVRQ